MKNLMKENFESPMVKIVAFDLEDIVRTSGEIGGGGSGGTDSSFIPGENEGPFVPAN